LERNQHRRQLELPTPALITAVFGSDLAMPGSVAPSYLCSGTHPEGRIGYREWARGNGRLGDIHSVDDRYDHDVDELMA
jgi:hypothetical protein